MIRLPTQRLATIFALIADNKMKKIHGNDEFFFMQLINFGTPPPDPVSMNIITESASGNDIIITEDGKDIITENP